MSKQVIDLSRVEIHLITDPEQRREWNDNVSRFHYLGNANMCGEQLRYEARYNGYVVAYIGFSSSVKKLNDREDWLGWTPAQKAQRQQLIAQNARFVIVPGMAVANLASRCLALCLKRLSRDWQTIYRHPIELVETFVERDRNLGTCYKACGWKEIGATKGFARTTNHYRRHGIIKRYFVKELTRGARQRLAARTPHPHERPVAVPLANQFLNAAPDASRPSLFAIIDQHVTDPRKRSGQTYPFVSLIAILLTGLLAGNTTVAAIARWAEQLSQSERKRLACRNRLGRGYLVPCANTLRYLLQEIKPNEFAAAVKAWLAANGITSADARLAIDGKVLCGSAEEKGGPQQAQITLYDVERDLVIDQEPILAGESEIVLARTLLERNDLTNSLITADAAHAQVDTLTIIEKKTPPTSRPSKATSPHSTRTSRRPSAQPHSKPPTPQPNAHTDATKFAASPASTSTQKTPLSADFPTSNKSSPSTAPALIARQSHTTPSTP